MDTRSAPALPGTARAGLPPDQRETAARIVALDALRGMAALSVAIPHFFMSKYPGNPTLEFISVLGVEVFFILSGFVLAPQILFCLQEQTARRFGIFVIRRWMRTLPPYIVALTVVAIL